MLPGSGGVVAGLEVDTAALTVFDAGAVSDAVSAPALPHAPTPMTNTTSDAVCLLMFATSPVQA
jgi:hypothetical protein